LNRPVRPILIITLGLFSSSLMPARQIVVAHSGHGQYRTIQAAVDSISSGNTERQVVFIRNGTYAEQVRINNSFITLQGEDRKKTRIVASVDTSACKVAPDESKEEHCAVVLGNGTDLVFENLTIENTVHPGKGKGAALSLVKDSTRTLVHNVDVIGYGGDTFVLSAHRNRIGAGGEYYVKGVYVSGTYHIIVPRGATYVTNSSFWCLGGEKNCLFAEGITRETDKLVIRDSIIDGPQPFGLGSYFRDAAWYFLNDTFGSNLLPDGSIHREPARNYEMKWGEGRIYFAGSKGPAYPWLSDNFAKAPAKSPDVVTAAWAFPAWNPESTAGPRILSIRRRDPQVEVAFNEGVTVEGHPKIVLSSGKARYEKGSGTTTLLFKATSAGQPVRIDLNGGSIFASAASLQRRDASLKIPDKRD
jgi:pectinesterase